MIRRPRSWLVRWASNHPNALAILLVVAVAAGGLWNAHLQRVELCEKVEGQRALLGALVDTAIAEDSGSGLQLTGLPEFQALDQETKDYMAALEERSQESRGSSTADRLRRFRAEQLSPSACG